MGTCKHTIITHLLHAHTHTHACTDTHVHTYIPRPVETSLIYNCARAYITQLCHSYPQF